MMRFLIAFLWLCSLSSAAVAHEWYSKRMDPVTLAPCCGGKDCAPLVIKPGMLEAEEDGYRIRLTEEQAKKINPQRYGSVDVLVEWARIQPSEDGNFHICIPPYHQPQMRADLYCFFAPGDI